MELTRERRFLLVGGFDLEDDSETEVLRNPDVNDTQQLAMLLSDPLCTPGKHWYSAMPALHALKVATGESSLV